MKRITPSLITLVLSLLLAIFSAALTYSTPSEAKMSFSADSFHLQKTPASQVKDQSEIGSTNEIVIMGGVICLIIVVPIMMTRRSWR